MTRQPLPGLRGPRDAVRGLVHFPRMIDKARLHARGLLPPAYVGALGRGFDRRVCELLRVDYRLLADHAASHPELGDESLLAWAEERGRKPTEGDIEVLSDFLRKRGWRDDASDKLGQAIAEAGYPRDGSIATFFDFIDHDEGRPRPPGA
ncbi:MAG: DUF5069 domain-containing protein [Opitutia bacterium]|jgi:hypothetical protein